MEITYPGDGKEGQIKLSISPNRPAHERQDAHREHKELAKVLNFNAVELKHPETGEVTGLVINTGDRHPSAYAMFMAQTLEDKNLVKQGEASPGITTMLTHMHEHDKQLYMMKAPEVSDPMKAALDRARDMGVAKIDIKHTTPGHEYNPASDKAAMDRAAPGMDQKKTMGLV